MNENRVGPLATEQLEKLLFQAADILRGDLRASDYGEVIAPLLILKRASDQPGLLTVPDLARWSHVVTHHPRELGDALNRALWALEKSNPSELKGLFDRVDFNRRVPGPSALQRLIYHFDPLRLSDDHLEFGDVLGRAYDGFLSAVSMSDRRSGEFYTPRAVCRLLAELVRPQEGQSVYDPCAGSGGMLLQAAHYVEQHDGNEADLALYGQEKNNAAWFNGALNLFLNGIRDTSVSVSDCLADPLLEHGRIKQFDRVLTAPPFSMNYVRHEVGYPERMIYGWTPEGGKKADLMFVQHVLAVLRPDGVGTVVAPHGVLFRGGAEADIRRRLIEDGRLEAVIGIGPNVFHNTALPACILVLRGTQGLPTDRRGSVLFINAEHEIASGRAQNRLEPQHVERIVKSFQSWEDIPGFASVVSLDDIAANDFNLNIRRYVDTDPSAEPLLDVRAALTGGVPKREIDLASQRFRAFGIDLDDLFQPSGPHYVDFLEEGYEATAARIPELAADLERRFIFRSRDWWQQQYHLFADAAGTNRLFTSGLRSQLRSSFCADLMPLKILGEHQLTGVLASWWSDHEDDLRSLNHRGFTGVVDRWHSTRPSWLGTSRIPSEPDIARVLDALGDDLCSRVRQLVVTERQSLVATYLSWGDRYATSLADLERRYETAAARLKARMAVLGHM
ncbi:N-6 DNA methylase [Streptomyces sp. NPDC101249]|uniref:type I restriction-modification system subunit M n=1 Tax=Streptomyces sp. NPDC101249 TaxID=3366140 RepID=UPI003803677E